MKYKITAAVGVMLILIFTLPVFTLFAASTAEISVETNKMATVGNTFTLKVAIDENPGFSELTMNLTYNAQHMTLKSVEMSGELYDEGAKLECTENIGAQPYAIIIEAEDNVTFTGTLLTLTFTLDSAELDTNYPVNLSVAEGAMCDKDGKIIDVKCVSGGVFLECYHNRRTLFYQ